MKIKRAEEKEECGFGKRKEGGDKEGKKKKEDWG